MPVRRAEHPKEQLRGHQSAEVAFGVDRLLQQREQHAQPGTALCRVLHQRRGARRLAEVLLHQPQQALAIVGNHPVKALDHQHPLLAKGRNLRVGYR